MNGGKNEDYKISLKKAYMKKYFLIFLFIPTIIFTAEKLNIQEKNETIKLLEEKHTREIYVLKKQHLQEIARYRIQIATLMAALEQTKSNSINPHDERHPLAAMYGYK